LERKGPDNGLQACGTEDTLSSPSHKELHCRGVFLDLVPLDLIGHPRYAVVRTIGIEFYRSASCETVRDRL
jgi:hypothetical protein